MAPGGSPAIHISRTSAGGHVIVGLAPEEVYDLALAVAHQDSAAQATAEAHRFLVDPVRRWEPERYPPSSLLRAEYAVVPFQGRAELLTEIWEWTAAGPLVALRLYGGRRDGQDPAPDGDMPSNAGSWLAGWLPAHHRIADRGAVALAARRC